MLILASASPRRRELLTQAGLEFAIEAADIDESALPGEAAAAYVQRVATEKAQAICARHRDHPHRAEEERLTILAADTAVVLPEDGLILGKPVDPRDAARMLSLLSGRTHAVMTGIAAVALAADGHSLTVADVEITQVTMNLIDPAEISRYVDSGEPLDKAGAYAIQGYAARWIPRIEGCYFNVVGLPIARVLALLAEAGAKLDDAPHPR
jgi:septum formation protein